MTARSGSSAFLIRHGRTVSLVGGLLVAAIGLAMIFDLLILLPQYFRFFVDRMSDPIESPLPAPSRRQPRRTASSARSPPPARSALCRRRGRGRSSSRS